MQHVFSHLLLQHKQTIAVARGGMLLRLAALAFWASLVSICNATEFPVNKPRQTEITSHHNHTPAKLGDATSENRPHGAYEKGGKKRHKHNMSFSSISTPRFLQGAEAENAAKEALQTKNAYEFHRDDGIVKAQRKMRIASLLRKAAGNQCPHFH